MEKISPVYARFVLREVLRRDIPAERLLERTSLSRGELETGSDISMGDFLAILEDGSALIGDQQLGLLIGRHTNIIALGVLGAAAAIAPSLREGLQVVENYTRLHISYIRVELLSSLRWLSVQFHFLRDTGFTARFHAETAVMMIQHYVESMTGRPLENARYRFAFPAPDYADEYACWLNSPVVFGCDYTSVELPAEGLDLPSPYYNAAMWDQATLELSQRIRELESAKERPYTQYVNALLRSSEPPLPDLGSAAARLHISERTLNRRLQAEQTRFREIRNNVLAGWARQNLIETDQSVEAIALALGYQDAANFRRAFRNNEGCSPNEFRRANRSNVSR